jgi:hypothetical protein
VVPKLLVKYIFIFCILGKFSSLFCVLSGVSQCSALNPILFISFINDLFAKISYSKFLFCADDLKIYRDIKSVVDCETLQADVDSVQQWCVWNLTFRKLKLYISHIRSILSTSISLFCQ